MSKGKSVDSSALLFVGEKLICSALGSFWDDDSESAGMGVVWELGRREPPQLGSRHTKSVSSALSSVQ